MYVLIGAYIAAINVYSVTLLLSLRNDFILDGERPLKGDGKLILCALLGGAIGIYAAMFITRFKLKDLAMMILMPVIGAVNIWVIIAAFRSVATFIVV